MLVESVHGPVYFTFLIYKQTESSSHFCISTGFGDILGTRYLCRNNYCFNLFQNLSGAVSYFYSDSISLSLNAGICMVMAVLNIVGFYMADRRHLWRAEETPTSAEKPQNGALAKG